MASNTGLPGIGLNRTRFLETDKEDFMQDFVSLVTGMVAGLYGLQGSERKK